MISINGVTISMTDSAAMKTLKWIALIPGMVFIGAKLLGAYIGLRMAISGSSSHFASGLRSEGLSEDAIRKILRVYKDGEY